MLVSIFVIFLNKLKIDPEGNVIFSDTNLNLPGTPLIDRTKQFVSRSKNIKKREGKKHACYFCGALITDQIIRHIKSVHKNNSLVIEALQFGEEQGHSILKTFVARGDYRYNISAEAKGQEIIVARKPNARKEVKPTKDPKTDEIIFPKSESQKTIEVVTNTKNQVKFYTHDIPQTESADKFTVCKFCFKKIRKTGISKHKCIMENRIPGQKGILQECENMIPDIHPLASTRLRNFVLKTMHDGVIKNTIKKDEFIIIFGNDRVEYYTKDQDYRMISHQLRLMGELLNITRKSSTQITEFKDLMSHENVTLVCDSIKQMAEYDADTAAIKKGNKPRELGTLLKEATKFFINICIEKNKNEAQEKAEKFLKLLGGRFKELNKKALECNLRKAKSKPALKIPKVDDIKKFSEYVETQRQSAFEILKAGWYRAAFVLLNKSTLVLLQIFNRKRQGEVSRLLVEDLKESCIHKLDDACIGDEYTKLDEEAKKIAKNYVRVSITNKKGFMNVGLIIHLKLIESINLILENRANEGIKENNKYVFAKKTYKDSVDKWYESYIAIREFSAACGVKDHTSLRGTLMRKQVATMMYGLDLKDKNLKDLTTFLGHDYEIHKNYYIQRIPVRELMSTTPLLEIAQGTSEERLSLPENDLCPETVQNNTVAESSTSEYEPSFEAGNFFSYFFM